MTQSQSPGLYISDPRAFVGHCRQSLYDMLAPLLSICPGSTQLSFIRGGSVPSSTSYPFIYHFSQKRHPLRTPSSFHIPSLELCILFKCCNCTVF